MLPNSTENKLKIIAVVFAVLLLADLAAINFKVFSPQKLPSLTASLPTPTTEMPRVSPVVFPSETPSLPTAPPTPSAASAPMAKEIYIPLGNGSTKSLDWTGISGAEVVLDTANFPKIKSMIFEAFLQIPTGNGKAYAKLYNITDQHDVWLSEVAVEGGGVQRAESKNINFDAGRKVYRVMMKTTMGYEAILESARLKIILE